MIRKVKTICDENRVFIVLISIFVIAMLIYVSASSSNVPVMDYWRYANNLIEKSMNGGVAFHDIYSVNGVHRSPLQILFFLLNVKVFHWNTQVAIYLAVFVLAIFCTVLYFQFKKTLKDEKSSVIGGLVFLAVVFNYAKWEIYTLEFAFSFAFGILCQFLCLVWTDKFLRNIDEQKKNVFALSFLYILLICTVSGGQFAGFAGCMSIVIIWDYLMRNSDEKKSLFGYYICLGAAMVVGMLLYMNGLDVGNGVLHGLSLSLLWEIPYGILLMLGSSLIGSGHALILTGMAGIAVLIITIIGCYTYIHYRLYKITYIPAMMLVYSILYIFLCCFGRGLEFGMSYVTSSRYIYYTDWILIANVWILMLKPKKEKNKRRNSLWLRNGILVLFSVCSLYTYYNEWKYAPYRKDYYQNLIQKMYQIDNISDEDLIGFQAGNPDYVRNVVGLMKKYHLGVFYWENNE